MPQPYDRIIAFARPNNLLGEEEGKITRRIVAVNDVMRDIYYGVT
ncbi:unnamed protein product [Strongylus vulgaris]|uniref:Uncharacterized protein n=1 Tax=Strongylus vulgaris TaxID=40348 RepID=A0A3P7KAC4_STRVU|nr:unnamed protein product [Strongylus vulgaris]